MDVFTSVPLASLTVIQNLILDAANIMKAVIPCTTQYTDSETCSL